MLDDSRLHYSLIDVAEMLGIQVNDVLHYGLRGIISIMVNIPENLNVIQHQKKLTPGHIRVAVEGLPNPLYLALKPSYCGKIETTEEIYKSEFPYGYYLPDSNLLDKTVQRELLRIYPGIETDSVEDPIHVWVTVEKPIGSHCWDKHIFATNGKSFDLGRSICIKRSNLYVPRSYVNILIDELKLNSVSGCFKDPAVKKNEGSRAGLTIKSLSTAFNEVGWDQVKWGKFLDIRLKWVEEARLSAGVRGGVAATFNPVIVALRLQLKYPILDRKLGRAFSDNESLHPWADDWHLSQSPYGK